MFSVGGERSGRDLYLQFAQTSGVSRESASSSFEYWGLGRTCILSLGKLR